MSPLGEPVSKGESPGSMWWMASLDTTTSKIWAEPRPQLIGCLSCMSSVYLETNKHYNYIYIYMDIHMRVYAILNIIYMYVYINKCIYSIFIQQRDVGIILGTREYYMIFKWPKPTLHLLGSPISPSCFLPKISLKLRCSPDQCWYSGNGCWTRYDPSYPHRDDVETADRISI